MSDSRLWREQMICEIEKELEQKLTELRAIDPQRIRFMEKSEIYKLTESFDCAAKSLKTLKSLKDDIDHINSIEMWR